MIYPASNFGWVIPRTTGLGLVSWLQRVFESSAYPGVGLAGSRQPASDSAMIHYPNHPHFLLEPTSVIVACNSSHSQGMGLIIILVADTRLNLSGCRQRSSSSRRFILHWEGRIIPRRGTINPFTLFPQRQGTSPWSRRHTSQTLPSTRPTRLAAYWFSVSASITHSLYHQNFVPICVASRRISGYAPLRSPCTAPTPLHSLLGNSDANFPT